MTAEELQDSTLPASPSSLPTADRADPPASSSAALGPFCSLRKAAHNGPQQGWPESRGALLLSPPSHSPLFTQGRPAVLGAPVTAGQDMGLPWAGGATRRYRGTRGWGIWLPWHPLPGLPGKCNRPLLQGCIHLPEAPPSPEKDSLMFPAPQEPWQSCQPQDRSEGRGGKRGGRGLCQTL